MVSCCAYGCTNATRTTKKRGKPTVMFHRFPKDPIRSLQWVLAIKRSNWMPTKYSRICSEHFKDDDLYVSVSKLGIHSVHLKSDAIPTVFKGFPIHLQEAVQKFETDSFSDAMNLPEQDFQNVMSIKEELLSDNENLKTNSSSQDSQNHLLLGKTDLSSSENKVFVANLNRYLEIKKSKKYKFSYDEKIKKLNLQQETQLNTHSSTVFEKKSPTIINLPQLNFQDQLTSNIQSSKIKIPDMNAASDDLKDKTPSSAIQSSTIFEKNNPIVINLPQLIFQDQLSNVLSSEIEIPVTNAASEIFLKDETPLCKIQSYSSLSSPDSKDNKRKERSPTRGYFKFKHKRLLEKCEMQERKIEDLEQENKMKDDKIRSLEATLAALKQRYYMDDFDDFTTEM